MSKLPTKKHDKDELASLRAQSAMQQAQVDLAQVYTKKMANKLVLFLGYFCSLFAPFWLMVLLMKGAARYGYSMNDVIIMGAGVGLALLIALYVFVWRSLSRHHSSFITILALLGSFSIVYVVVSDKALKEQLLGKKTMEEDPIQSQADRLLEESINEALQKQQAEALKKKEAEELRKR